MNYNEKAIKILGDSLAQHKKVIQDIQKSISENKTLQSKEAKQLQADIKEQLTEVDSAMRSYIKAIRIPEDGKDAKVDYEALHEFIMSKVVKIEPEKIDYDKINSSIKKEVSKLPKPKNGKDAEKANDGVDGKDAKIDYTKVNQDIMAQFPKRAIIEDIQKQIPKQEKVVGIKEIKLEKDKLIIITTDGKKKSFSLSTKNYQLFGGGGVTFKPSLLPFVDPYRTDTMMIMRDNKEYQVTLESLHTFFNLGFPKAVVNAGIQVINGTQNIVTTRSN